ncbi:MAG: endolytic transglycosylase MltG, partial [Novosphingobium sp.]|nr:endolytic transglycosylase MltG [Novosphingobium sp.]
MLFRRGCWPLVAAGLLALAALGWLVAGWFTTGPLKQDTAFLVADGSSLSGVATKLEREGAIDSAEAFRLRARIFGAGAPIKAGEFMLPKGASPSQILSIIQGDEVLRRFVTVPEGMPSIMVYERLMANSQLTGSIEVPPEGSILPDTYEIERGESRQAVLLRMQVAMNRTLAELWAKRSPNSVVKTPQEALILAGIVEKETGKPSERRLVAGLYSNRIRQGIMLQADPTIIYPITKGKPLGRRIRQSEIQAVND